jgi:Integrase core domain
MDNALAETVIGYYKAELIRGPARTGPWKTVDEVELATLGWVHWHNTQRLHGYLRDLPPAEFEALHAAREDLDSGVLSVARPARKAAERLPQPHLDAVEGQIASESLLEAPPVNATALTAGAP